MAKEPETKVEVVEVKTTTPAGPKVEVATIPQALERIKSDQQKAREENRKRAAAAVGRYRVTLGEGDQAEVGEYDARNADEAWAMFCDGHKTWPSPKFSQRSVVKVG